MIKQLLAKASARKTHVGIELQPNGLAVAICADNWEQKEAEDVDRPQIFNTSYLLNESSEAKQTLMLSDWVEKNGLQKAGCSVVLSNSDYQLLLVEAPDVPESDMREAIRWRVKDLSSIPVAEAAMDVFMLPVDGSRGGKRMAYVVVSALSKIKSVIEMVSESGLELVSIDIGEMALRNVAYLQELENSESRGVAIVRLLEGKGCVSLYRKGNLYLSRQFQIQYGGGLLDDIPIDSFILEVQRSLDYYERQMGQQPPTALYICGDNVSEDKITMDVIRGLNVPVKYLSLSQAVIADKSAEESLMHACVAAMGGALRETVENHYRAEGGQ